MRRCAPIRRFLLPYRGKRPEKVADGGMEMTRVFVFVDRTGCGQNGVRFVRVLRADMYYGGRPSGDSLTHFSASRIFAPFLHYHLSLSLSFPPSLPPYPPRPFICASDYPRRGGGRPPHQRQCCCWVRSSLDPGARAQLRHRKRRREAPPQQVCEALLLISHVLYIPFCCCCYCCCFRFCKFDPKV